MKKKVVEELNEIYSDYTSLPAFIRDYNKISLINFDYYIVNKFSLFVINENFDFESLEQIIEKMENTLPSIKRIFAKPIIHLTERDEILPVEAVKLINNNTINHIASHSELWDDVKEEKGIKPSKLLTRTYDDNYGIYENIVFTKTINQMLSYLRKNIRDLKNLMYASNKLEFNLLERVNHIQYFLAIGKLHTGYIRDFNKYYDIAKVYYDRMNLIYTTLSARLKRNVYRLNKNYKGTFRLHNSNILHMQKDYHKVYVLLKHFHKIKKEESNKVKNVKTFFNNYLSYLKIICIFSIMHFNFHSDDSTTIDFSKFNLLFTFKNWELFIKLSKKKNGILFQFHKDKYYTILLKPSLVEEDDDEEEEFDECITITPFMCEEEHTYISISDVESFRRIQQIILKGMIYSDETFDECMFCGEPLKKVIDDENGDQYYCKSCRTVVRENTCNVHNKKYYSTTIDNYHSTKKYDIDTSELYHFRNITEVNGFGDIICPHCGKVHKN